MHLWFINPMKLVTVAQMRAIEEEADANGVSYATLMQTARSGVAKLVHAAGQQHDWQEVTGSVGSGNNGGDTLVALAARAQDGWHTHAYLVRRKEKRHLLTPYLDADGVAAGS